jgi:mono/diheme cytochrome c family protein
MRSLRLPLLVTVAGVCHTAWAQSPTYGLGRTPSAEEIRAWDISIGPAGKELPPGRGTAKEGAQLYVRKGCAACHGANGYGGRAPTLIENKGAPATPAMPGMEMGIQPPGIMATHAPFSNVIWDYINRGMPLNKEQTLTPDEVYSLTAFLLFKNGVIKEDEVMDAQSLAKLKMPNRSGYTPPPEWKHGTPRLLNYP